DTAEADGAPGPPLTLRHLGVLLSLLAGIVVMVWGIGAREWYVIEIGAVFLGIGLLAAVFAAQSPTETATAFTEGARELLSAAIVIGMARGIVLLAADLRLLDPALHAAASGLAELHGVASINAMFVFQSLVNFLVPSGSGQAALTMPIMAPLADLIGLTRQQAVLAFQFGDGFTNLITPTSAVLMGCIEAGRCRYEEWFRFAWRLQIWLLVAGAVLLSLTVVFGYGR
ncbi:MAG: YfcC family protein, partial [Acidobacteria bacterium]|nr:YfcC family protein [Acidobacteriota bacterium]